MKQFIVDAFTDKVFAGNPASVIILDEWLPDELMINITKESGVTAAGFAVRLDELGEHKEKMYHLRWMTPGGEISLCGHATLATSFVILTCIDPPPSTSVDETRWVSYKSQSGVLQVKCTGNLFELNFPEYELKQVEVTPSMTEALGVKPVEAYLGRDLLCVLKDENEVRNLTIKQEKAHLLDGLLLHVTARGSTSAFDCVSRTFGPKTDIIEDPVCGSGHCHIAPYWGKKLNKQKIIAYQASCRGGTVFCDLSESKRVKLSGNAALFSTNEIHL